MTDRITDTRTHKENIDKLSVQGGPFDAWGANSTYQKAIDPLSEDASLTKERKELHKRLLDKYKETHGYDNIDTERKTIMMAGAPGAGKSTTLKRALDGSPDTYLPIDPDAFKVLLIEEAIKSGEINTFYNIPEVKQLTDQGEKFFPMDFGSLVHQESTYLASELLEDAIADDKNVIIDKVYSNPKTLQDGINDLAENGYTDISLINVEVTQENSHNRVYSRWEHDYTHTLTTGQGLGGRPVPAEFIDSVFDPKLRGEHPSGPARATYEAAKNNDTVTSYTVWDNNGSEPQRIFAAKGDSLKAWREAGAVPATKPQPNRQQSPETQLSLNNRLSTTRGQSPQKDAGPKPQQNNNDQHHKRRKPPEQGGPRL